MRIFKGLSDLESALGQPLGPGPWFEVDQARIDRFADATEDHQWIHVDPERAATGPFKATIAHGYLTLSLLPALMREVYELRGVRFAMNYGLDKVRFPHPVAVGSRLRAYVTPAELVESPAGTRVAFDVSVEEDGIAKPVCIARFIVLVVP